MKQNDPFSAHMAARRELGKSLAARRAWYANMSITAANVLAGPNAKILRDRILGETVTQGQIVCRQSDNRYYLADANVLAHVLALLAGNGGYALGGGAAGQPVDVDYEDDDFTPGFTVSGSVAGDSGVYVLSATPGATAPMDDLAAAMYPVIMGTFKTAAKINLKIVVGTGILVA